MINIIVAIAQNRVIGGDNSLLWHISEDLRHFKSITMGHPVVMGRKTYESIGRPLPKRENIVISRTLHDLEGCVVVGSLEEALEQCHLSHDVFIIGGAEIYSQALPLADRLFITEVEHNYEGDTLFPEWEESEWLELSRERFERGESYPHPFSFVEYRRVKSPAREWHIAELRPIDAPLIRHLAEESFPQTYGDIVSGEQIDYMMEWMYSLESIKAQFDEGQHYYALYLEGEPIGYLSLHPEDGGKIHLEKLYLLPAYQGRGFGRTLIEFAFKESLRLMGGETCRVELNVNRGNSAVHFYHRNGMQVAYEVDQTIEDTEFQRNDYILYKEL